LCSLQSQDKKKNAGFKESVALRQLTNNPKNPIANALKHQLQSA